MPYLSLCLSSALDGVSKDSLMKGLSALVTECLQKPEEYVMVTVEEKAIIMSGNAEPAAFAALKSIGGISPEGNRMFSQKLCALLKEKLGIMPERVYVNFSDISAENWGWNGTIFA